MLAKIAIALISAYQFCLSPIVGNQCRFHPSCSRYTKEALRRHGFLKGCYLGIKRILSCHPFHEGGCDPVPEEFSLTNPKN